MKFATLAATLVAAVLPVSNPGWAQSDNCLLAGDGICQEVPYGMPPVCPIMTDASDCASAQIAYGSDDWALDPDDLIGRSTDWLRLARNEIFARHGRTFNSPDLDTLFRARNWYQPSARDVTLNPVEQSNVALLARFGEDPLFPLTDAGWPTPSGSWTAVLQADGQASRPISGLGPFVRLDPASKDQLAMLLRTDHDLAYAWTPGEANGSAFALGGFVDVPLTVRTLAAYQVAVTPDGHDVIDGEPVERFVLTGVDNTGQTVFDGTALVTPDGIVVEAEYDYLFRGCCGDEPEWQRTRYRLTDLNREPLDPARFEPPIMDYVMAG